jgi:hypothetical protein
VTSQSVADATMTVLDQTWAYEISQGFSYAATTVIDRTWHSYSCPYYLVERCGHLHPNAPLFRRRLGPSQSRRSGGSSGVLFDLAHGSQEVV